MNSRLAMIVELNDLLRTTFLTGKVVLTRGIAVLDELNRNRVLDAVRSFSEFTPDNDPGGEHDFGAFDLHGIGRIFWKIDYFDLALENLSPDPANASPTSRVLTIMRAEEC